ncbi:DUF1223 domain-containing protein [Aliishimia ponticola]|uniref:DUF1223 domain-containing protein n=2 Tax=Aliishimia ponticola TaxID=2499833 RepID=A0A4S4NHP8_9RHOB|nr:DUF1223 domain-containing protein [Aliishimia ponticola]
MVRIALFPLIAWTFAAAPALAQDRAPVVVELFTSQGCSSCPPADKLMGRLAERDDVIALALHVDYWDYIGWKDVFADPANSERQRAYAKRAGRRSVYTPQMIVNGEASVVGARPMEVSDAIDAAEEMPMPVAVTLTREGGALSVTAEYSGAAPVDMVVNAIRYEPSQDVHITRGENAGRTLRYHNVVTQWQVLDKWRGAETFKAQVDLPGAQPVVVIVQAAGHGPVLGAARLR